MLIQVAINVMQYIYTWIALQVSFSIRCCASESGGTGLPVKIRDSSDRESFLACETHGTLAHNVSSKYDF